jgi:uncharacterized protein (DUF427 family)
MKIPGPDHPITVEPAPRRVRAKVHEHVIADTADALMLKEADYPPVFYFPRGDVETGFLSQTSLVTHCPYKGDATHFAMMIDGVTIEKAAWSYQDPYPAMEAIKDLVAFYPGEIEIYEVDDLELDERHRGADEGERPDRIVP